MYVILPKFSTLTNGRFGTYCAHLNFSNVYKVYCDQNADASLYLGDIPAGTTNKTVILEEGTWYWKVAAFNGRNSSTSPIQSFTICHPGTLSTPTLYPEAGAIAISTVNLTWLLACTLNFFLFKLTG